MARVVLDVITHFSGDENALKAFKMAGYSCVADVTRFPSPAGIVEQLQSNRSELLGKVDISQLPPRVLDHTVMEVWQKCREASGLSALPSDSSRKRNRDSISTMGTTSAATTSGTDSKATGFEAWQKLTEDQQKQVMVSFHTDYNDGALRPLHTYIRDFLVTNYLYSIQILYIMQSIVYYLAHQKLFSTG